MASTDLAPSDATLPREDILRVLDSREGLRAVLEGLAARPSLSAGELLRVFVWLASSECGWMDGNFVVVVSRGDGPDTTRAEVMEDLGGGVRERVVPVLTFRVDEAALERLFERMSPLLRGIVMSGREDGALVFRHDDGIAWEERETDRPDPPALSDSVLATAITGVSDEFMGELSELAANRAETDGHPPGRKPPTPR